MTTQMPRLCLPPEMIMDLYEEDRVTGELLLDLVPGSDPSLIPVGSYVILGIQGLGDVLVGVVAEADPEAMTLTVVA